MKKFFMLAVVLMSSAMVALAQRAEEPEFENEPFIVNLKDSTLGNPLPVENAYTKEKASASMYITDIGKIKSYYYVNGVASPMVLDGTESLVINLGGKSPLQTLSINKFDVQKKTRRYQTGEMGTFTGVSVNNDKAAQTFRYKKYGKNSVLIPLSALEEGEYCLSITNAMTNSKSAKVYTFRIKKEK